MDDREELEERLRTAESQIEDILESIDEPLEKPEDSDVLVIEQEYRQVIVHWITEANCEEIDSEEKAKEAFVDAVEARDAGTEGDRIVAHGDLMIIHCGTEETLPCNWICFVAGVDRTDTYNVGFQGPAPESGYAAPQPSSGEVSRELIVWSTCAEGGDDACSHDHESDVSAVTAVSSTPGVVSVNLTPQFETCVKSGTESEAEFLKSDTTLQTTPKLLPTNVATTSVPTDFTFDATVDTDYTLADPDTYDDIVQPDEFIQPVKTVDVEVCDSTTGSAVPLKLFALAGPTDTVAGYIFTDPANIRVPKATVTVTATPDSSTAVTIPSNWSSQDVPTGLNKSSANAITSVGTSATVVKEVTGSSSTSVVTGISTSTTEVAGKKKDCEESS